MNHGFLGVRIRALRIALFYLVKLVLSKLLIVGGVTLGLVSPSFPSNVLQRERQVQIESSGSLFVQNGYLIMMWLNSMKYE